MAMAAIWPPNPGKTAARQFRLRAVLPGETAPGLDSLPATVVPMCPEQEALLVLAPGGADQTACLCR